MNFPVVFVALCQRGEGREIISILIVGADLMAVDRENREFSSDQLSFCRFSDGIDPSTTFVAPQCLGDSEQLAVCTPAEKCSGQHVINA